MRVHDRPHEPRKRQAAHTLEARPRQEYEVWRFLGVSVPQPPNFVAHLAYPSSDKYQNEYNRIVWRGMATSKEDALQQYKSTLTP